MNRLKKWIFVLAALVLTACSGSAPVDRADAGQSGLDRPGGTVDKVTEQEIAVPGSSTAVPSE
ncbi:MAG TPA: hypothetical protein ENO21_01805, partial [Firmicutes bacterium]|nr:hypothetical protein [Bacillota bacterium]